jgi:Skp family chaperone for outer membrane proteins
MSYPIGDPRFIAENLKPETLEIPDNVRREIERLQEVFEREREARNRWYREYEFAKQRAERAEAERDEAREELKGWQDTAMEHDDAVALVSKLDEMKAKVLDAREERDAALAWEPRANAFQRLVVEADQARARAEAALREIYQYPNNRYSAQAAYDMHEIARDALEGK